MSIFSIILFGFIEGGALGFAYDPLVEGISFKLGTKQGFYSHLILNFETGETKVDSAKSIWHQEDYYRKTEYEESFWRPYFWVNFGLRIERYFTRKSWYQPYVGVGIEGTKGSSWGEKWERKDTTSITIPELVETFSYGPTGVIGVAFYPLLLLSKLARFELPFSDAISFNIEIFTFYLLKHEPDEDWRGQRKNSEIGWGGGIHFNW